MILLAGFLDVLFRAMVFVGLALSVGGIVFCCLVLRPSGVSDASLRKAASLVAAGAFVIAASQVLALLTAAAALSDQFGSLPILPFLHANFVRAGLVHAAAALVLGCLVLRLRRSPRLGRFWASAAVIGGLIMVNGAWLTHGASRLTNAYPLMAVTLVHQLAASVWIGGLIHLGSQWRLLRTSDPRVNPWTAMLARFSPLALFSVVVLLAAGLYLAREYIGSTGGLIGTAYGTMVLTKIALMSALLLLGGINNITIRRWQVNGDKTDLKRRVPVFAEVEAAIGIIILMTSAALTSQPPSIDVRDRATPAEVAKVFAPKRPQFVPPPHAEMLATANSSTDPYSLPNVTSRKQSDFNHNWSGIFVILIGIGAFINRLTRWRWTRHWPLLFLPLALFLLVIGEPNGWPLGPEPFWRTLVAPEVLAHRLATVIVAVLGLVMWRVETGPWEQTRWRYLLPVLSFVGGALLLTHSHSVFAIKRAFLIEVSHNALAIFAVFAGAGAWLELRILGREQRIAGILWPIFFVLVGVVLLFYREA